jgi:hypothetical protein
MVPVGKGSRREYANMHRSFTCCVGTGMESHALHGLGLYYEAAAGDRLWVNLYAPSVVQWDSAGVTLTMDTTFPEGDSARLSLGATAPRAFTLSLRRPSWAGDGFAVHLNGLPLAAASSPESYVDITRTWNAGDTVTLTLPKALRLDRTADNPRRAAVLWGPLVLAGDLGPQPSRDEDRADDIPTTITISSPVLVTDRPVTDWLRPDASEPGSFRTTGLDSLTLAPFYKIHRRHYTGYWDLLTPAENAARLKALEAERERARRLEAATIVFFAPTDAKPEQAHNQQGDETSLIRTDGRLGRRAAKWFSYDLPLPGPAPSVLVVTYNRDNRRARDFAVLVDGQRIGVEAFAFNSESRFFDREYALPPSLLPGKSQITVRIQATGTNEVAAVYGIRLARRG